MSHTALDTKLPLYSDLTVTSLSPLPKGKYMQMMNILKPIAFDVIHCVSQLFDYYLYAVYTFFGRNDMVQYSFIIVVFCLSHRVFILKTNEKNEHLLANKRPLKQNLVSQPIFDVAFLHLLALESICTANFPLV